MQVSFEHLGPLERKISITLPGKIYRDVVSQRLGKLTPTVKVDGFRAGKVPLPIIKKRFGAQLGREAMGEVINKYWSEAFGEEKERHAFILATEPEVILDEPQDVDQLDFDYKGDLVFSGTFEILPEAELDLTKISLKKPSVEITEGDVQHMLERVQKTFSEWKETDRAVQLNDRAVIDFEVFLAGVPLHEGGQAEDFNLDVGSKQMIPGFEEALLGHVAGDKFKFDLTFPEVYPPSAQLAGQKTVVEITVKSVLESSLPEINEAFLSERGITPPTLDQFKKQTREQMESMVVERTQAAMKSDLYQAIGELCTFDLPKSWVEAEMQALYRAEHADEQHQHHHHEHHEHAEGEACTHESHGIDKTVLETYRDKARRRVAVTLYLQKYIEQEKITLTPEEFNPILSRMLGQLGANPATLNQWSKSQQGQESIQRIWEQQLREKAMLHLLEQVEQVAEASSTSFFESPILMG